MSSFQTIICTIEKILFCGLVGESDDGDKTKLDTICQVYISLLIAFIHFFDNVLVLFGDGFALDFHGGGHFAVLGVELLVKKQNCIVKSNDSIPIPFVGHQRYGVASSECMFKIFRMVSFSFFVRTGFGNI